MAALDSWTIAVVQVHALESNRQISAIPRERPLLADSVEKLVFDGGLKSTAVYKKRYSLSCGGPALLSDVAMQARYAPLNAIASGDSWLRVRSTQNQGAPSLSFSTESAESTTLLPAAHDRMHRSDVCKIVSAARVFTLAYMGRWPLGFYR
jgi:hypothetical protein